MALLKQLAEKYGVAEQPEPAQPKVTSFFRRVAPAEQQHAAQQQMAADKEELHQKRIAEEEVTAARLKRPRYRSGARSAPTSLLLSSRGGSARWRGPAQRARPSSAPR